MAQQKAAPPKQCSGSSRSCRCKRSTVFVLLVVWVLALSGQWGGNGDSYCGTVQALSASPPSRSSSRRSTTITTTTTTAPTHTPLLVSRRQAVVAAGASAVTWRIPPATGVPPSPPPPPAFSMPSNPTTRLSNGVVFPRIGYSLYKTPADQVATAVRLALAAGVRQFDVATQYGTNEIVGRVLQDYIQRGRASLEEDMESIVVVGGSTAASNTNNKKTIPIVGTIPPTAAQRRKSLWVTHKISNEEQSLSKAELQAAVRHQHEVLLGKHEHQQGLGPSPPNMVVLIHSPLTDATRRLRAYTALQELYDQRAVAAVGVCHYSVAHLEEIVTAMPAPHLIQLALSPFQTHAHDVVPWARAHGCQLSCAAWSRLSSTDGPVAQWTELGNWVAQRNERYQRNNHHNNNRAAITKQQVLIQWAVQNGYCCVPRSSAKYKMEQATIYENAWPAVHALPPLSDEDLEFLNARLNKNLPVGQLGLTDGWNASDIVNATWDPTLLTV